MIIKVLQTVVQDSYGSVPYFCGLVPPNYMYDSRTYIKEGWKEAE